MFCLFLLLECQLCAAEDLPTLRCRVFVQWADGTAVSQASLVLSFLTVSHAGPT